MDKPYYVSPDIAVLPSHLPLPLPGLGYIPINSYVIKAKEPVLVDTGMRIETQAWLKSLESVNDPKEIRWIWLTHDDTDHTGSIQEVMAAAPKARLVGNALGALRMSSWWPFPMDRLYALNHGESISAGDRTLTAVRPPHFDNPTATGFVDGKGNFFSVDSFGAIIPSLVQDAADVPAEALAQGMTAWASADSPWLHWLDAAKFAQILNRVRQIGAKNVLSAHLPPAKGMTDRLVKILEGVPNAQPFVAPNQAALEQMMAQMKKGGPP